MSRIKQIMKQGYSSRNTIQLLKGGKDYFEKLQKLINKAASSIHLQFYIFLNDQTGTAVMNALKEASKRGVSVHLLLDAYASQELPQHSVDELRQAGIYVKWFEPLFRSKHFYFGRRLHHKVVVADGLYSLVGGLNICDRYNDMPDQPAWLDMALYCEGESSFALFHICQQMWGTKNNAPSIDWATIDAFCNQQTESEQKKVRVRRNDWVKSKNEIWRSYMEMCNRAEEQITIMSSYFIPGRLFRKKLHQAAKRGVSIRIIVAGISDIRIAKHAERYLYNWLLRNNIEIYEYQQTVLHAKISTYDQRWTTIGSYNLNNISAYASLELNMDIKDEAFAIQTEKALSRIMEHDCKRITKENYTRSTSYLKRCWQWLCYEFINTVLNLFTFYFKQE